MGKDKESSKLKEEEKKSKDEIHLKIKSKDISSRDEGEKKEVEKEIEAKFVEKEEVKDLGDSAGSARKGKEVKKDKEKDK